MPNCTDNLFFIGQSSNSGKTCATSDITMEFGAGCTGSGFCADGIGPRPKRAKTKKQVREYVLRMLGAPVISLEVPEDSVDFAIEESMRIVEEYAGKDLLRYYVFQTSPGTSVYSLPENDVGFVRNVFYRQLNNPASTASDLGGQVPLEFLYSGYTTMGFLQPQLPIWGSSSEFCLYKGYEQMYNRMSSSIGSWEFLGDQNHIKLYPIPCFAQQAIVQYIQACTDFGREYLIAIQEGALAFTKIMIGRIRSKFQNLPGPNGGMILDGQQILQEGLEEKKDWETRLIWRFGDIIGVSVG